MCCYLTGFIPPLRLWRPREFEVLDLILTRYVRQMAWCYLHGEKGNYVNCSETSKLKRVERAKHQILQERICFQQEEQKKM